MKTVYILYISILCFSLMSCDNLSEKERAAQNYMMQITEKTNEEMNLPRKLDDFTYGEKVKFDKSTNTIIYTCIIDKNDYGSESEFKKKFQQIKSDQIAKARINQGHDINYKILGVTIKSIYKNKDDDILYSFDIEPMDYLKSEIEEAEKLKNEMSFKLFSKEKFKVSFENGVNYNHNYGWQDLGKSKESGKLGYSSISEAPTTTLILKTEVGNRFGELIEKSEISIEIILEYKAGSLKFKPKSSIGSLGTGQQLREFYAKDFFKGRNTSLMELQGYSDYLHIVNNQVMSESDNLDLDESAMLKDKYLRMFYSANELDRLQNAYKEIEEYFKNDKRADNFNEYKNWDNSKNMIGKKAIYYFRIFKDFDRIKEGDYLVVQPTINKFKVENAVLNIYMTASNTNGFYFSDKIKSINIKEKWNNHFVQKY